MLFISVKKKVSIIGLILITILTQGCTATQQKYAAETSLIAIESSVLKSQYTRVETVLRQLQDEKNIFTDDEWRQLLSVDASIDILIAKYDAMTELDIVSLDIQDISFMWRLSVEGYTQARDVVYAHWSQFQPSTQILLNAFDQQAEDTNTRITELLKNPDNESITQALVLISGVLSIAVKMLSTAIIL